MQRAWKTKKTWTRHIVVTATATATTMIMIMAWIIIIIMNHHHESLSWHDGLKICIKNKHHDKHVSEIQYSYYSWGSSDLPPSQLRSFTSALMASTSNATSWELGSWAASAENCWDLCPKIAMEILGEMSLYRVFYHVLHHQNWINLDLWFTLILQIFRHIQTTPYDAYAVSFWSPSPSDWVLSQSLLLVRNLAPPQTEATEVVSAEIDQIDLISYLSDSIRLIRSL